MGGRIKLIRILEEFDDSAISDTIRSKQEMIRKARAKIADPNTTEMTKNELSDKIKEYQLAIRNLRAKIQNRKEPKKKTAPIQKNQNIF